VAIGSEKPFERAPVAPRADAATPAGRVAPSNTERRHGAIREHPARSGVTTVRGLQLHHLEWGPADGPPVVLVHGLRAPPPTGGGPAGELGPP
jgi:hypothetical protein